MDIKAQNYHDFSGLAALKKDAAQSPEEAAMPVARQFEALFVQMMLKSMRDTVPEGGLFSESGQKMYQDMLDSQLSVSMSEHQGIGLAEVIAKQLARQQGPAEPGSADLTATADSLRLQLRQARIQEMANGADMSSLER